MAAARFGQVEVVKMLLERGAKSRGVVGVEGLSAMDYAVKYGHYDVAEVLAGAEETVKC